MTRPPRLAALALVAALVLAVPASAQFQPSAQNYTPSRLSNGTAFLDSGATAALPVRLSDGTAFPDTRTELSYYANAVAAGATGVDTILTLTKSSGTAATSTATTFAPTSGKKFKIIAVTVSTRGHATATAQMTLFRLRLNPAGACTVTSTPIVVEVASGTSASSNPFDHVVMPLPEGYVLTGDGTLNFCVTAVATYVTNAPTWFVNLIGYEY